MLVQLQAPRPRARMPRLTIRRVVTVGGTKSDTGGAADLEMRAVAPIWVRRAECAAANRRVLRKLSTSGRSSLSTWSTSKPAELPPPRFHRGWPVFHRHCFLCVCSALQAMGLRGCKGSPARARIETVPSPAHSARRVCRPGLPAIMELCNVGEQSFVHLPASSLFLPCRSQVRSR